MPASPTGPFRHTIALAGVGLLAASIVGLATRDDPVAPAATEGAVVIVGFAFGPPAQQVRVGESLTWTNEDSAAHTVDSPDQELDSESIAEGQTFEHTFDAPGTYAYFCAFHPFMKGTVEVTA